MHNSCMHLTPPTLLATLASSLMNILPSPTKFRPSPKLAIIILESFFVSVLTSIPPQLASLPPPSFTPNSITVILLPKSQIIRLQQIQNSLACAVVKAPKSCPITPILRCLHWLKITERIEYKLLWLTYKVSTTTKPLYLHNLISVPLLRSIHSSCLVTIARPPTSSSLLAPFAMSHLVSGINFLVLSVNLISAPLCLTCLFMLLPHLLFSLC